MTAYYVVEEPDDFFPDDFGNDDAPQTLAAVSVDIDWDEDPDEFFADDFGNDDRSCPAAPLGLTVVLH